ncbi:hypothetical protein EDB82DRAFT_318012 [Fusarium venenatum]|uniref:uncharacterized protein n=1 Tax=Fusarium venenatum TaxID=56646 RepID=UPI001DF910CF|nr:hypothetical protein EDB82DRAFT_318012 [Fusarium venenatum]
MKGAFLASLAGFTGRAASHSNLLMLTEANASTSQTHGAPRDDNVSTSHLFEYLRPCNVDANQLNREIVASPGLKIALDHNSAHFRLREHLRNALLIVHSWCIKAHSRCKIQPMFISQTSAIGRLRLPITAKCHYRCSSSKQGEQRRLATHTTYFGSTAKLLVVNPPVRSVNSN